MNYLVMYFSVIIGKNSHVNARNASGGVCIFVKHSLIENFNVAILDKPVREFYS